MSKTCVFGRLEIKIQFKVNDKNKIENIKSL
jgi:hypothetical protein